MKRISVLTILPLLLFALEKVNLVKDHSFEKDSEVWHTRVGGGWPQIALVSRHDPESAYTGEYSGSGDTRPEPENPPLSFVQSAYVIQGFSSPKKTVEDIDSLTLFYSARYLYDDVDRSFLAYILLHLNANSEDFMKVGYILKRPGEPIGTQPHYAIFKSTSFTQDTLWHTLSEGISTDIRSWGSIPLNAVVDSFILWVTGFNLPPWRGQKVFFDDVRLMGFADYDVGVKEITSVTETIPYTPAALIKNFGREPAEFSVVAEILQGETQVYHDSID
ncbi:hypothetical protein JXM67_02100, partial [candidate division WOR-3 bacterium]|nr:hypothetical protein [candidate division WOR-3 bacterium]